MNPLTGNGLVIAGLVLIAVGIGFKLGLFSWFGQLPGDIRIERGNTRIFIPLTSMILISIVLSALLNLLRRF